MALIQLSVSDKMDEMVDEYQKALRRMGVKKNKDKILEDIIENSHSLLKQKTLRLNADYEKALKKAENWYKYLLRWRGNRRKSAIVVFGRANPMR